MYTSRVQFLNARLLFSNSGRTVKMSKHALFEVLTMLCCEGVFHMSINLGVSVRLTVRVYIVCHIFLFIFLLSALAAYADMLMGGTSSLKGKFHG